MVRKLFLCILVAALAIVPAFAAKKEKKSKTAKVDVTQVALAKATAARAAVASNGVGNLLAPRDPFAGLSEEERAAILNMIFKASPMKNSLEGSRYRVFGVEATPVKVAGGLQRQAHTLLYDYTKNKTYHIVNDITAGAPGTIIQTNTPGTQPPPHAEEYAEARAMVSELDKVKQLMKRPNVFLQDAFPVESGTPCDVDRCVLIEVNELFPDARSHFLLLVTVDLSARKIVEVREPKSPTSLAR